MNKIFLFKFLMAKYSRLLMKKNVLDFLKYIQKKFIKVLKIFLFKKLKNNFFDILKFF